MTFRNPVMLVGLAAALVPLVLHFLNRARYRNVPWGAMMFIDAMEPRVHHAARLKQWLLLLGRAAILGTLAAAMARPVLSAAARTPPAGTGRTAAVFLLDASGSMSLNDNGRVRLDVARETVFQLLSPGLKRGDDLYLVTLGDPAPRAAGPRPHATDPQEMARRVKDVTTASGRADVAAALLEAADLLNASRAPNREIYLVCDRQAASWAGVNDPDFQSRWRALTAAAPPRVLVIPVGTDEIDNVAVEAIDSSAEPFVVNQPGEIEVRLHNYGAVPRTAVTLDVTVRTPLNRTPSARHLSVNLPAGAVTRITVPVTFAEPGSNVVSARITAPGPTPDKHFDRAVEVLPSLQALIIDGDEREASSSTTHSGADFLRAALGPYRNKKRDPVTVTVARPDVWTPADLADVRVVIAANVPSFTEAQARALEQFVWDGGGLILAPGDQVRAENYNAQLPWLPASLAPPTAESEAGATTLGPVDPSHPIFRFLSGHADSAPPVPVRRYFPTAPRPGADVVARFADASPFILTRDAGRGRAVLLTTPVDPDWNALPLTNLFLPLAQSTVRYAAGGPPADAAATHNLPAGRPLVANFPVVNFADALDPKLVTVTLPNNTRADPARLTVTPGEYGTQVTFDGATTPGLYRVAPRPQPPDPRTQQFVVAEPSAESDLTPLADDQWDRLARTIGFARVDPDRRPPAAAQEGYREGLDLWLPLVGLAVVLAVIELAATRRWLARDDP